MWIVWVPLVAAWLALPCLALVRRSQWLHTPVMRPDRSGLRGVTLGGGADRRRLPVPDGVVLGAHGHGLEHGGHRGAAR